MRSFLLTLVVYLIVFQLNAIDSTKDKLWQKSKKIAENNWQYYPSKILEISEFLDKNDVVEKKISLNLECSQDETGELKQKFISAKIDNKEVTEDDGNIKRMMSDKDLTPQNNSLFHNNEFPVNIDRIGTEKINNFNCVIYKYERKIKNKKETAKELGKIWIAEDSGIPIKRLSTIEPLPKKVKKMNSYFYYELDENNRWILEKSIIHIKIKLFFISLNIKNTTNYKEYKIFESAKKQN